MTTFLVAFVVFAALFAAMAVGVIVSNKPLKGSCGGLNALGMKKNCAVCGGDDDECDRRKRESRGDPARLGHDVLET